MSHYDNLINLGNWLKSLNRLHHYSKGQFPLLLRSLLDHWDSWLHSVSLIISVECLITMLVQYVWGGGDDTKSLPGRSIDLKHWDGTLKTGRHPTWTWSASHVYYHSQFFYALLEQAQRGLALLSFLLLVEHLSLICKLNW